MDREAIKELYVFKWCDCSTKKMYVVMPFLSRDAALQNLTIIRRHGEYY